MEDGRTRADAAAGIIDRRHHAHLGFARAVLSPERELYRAGRTHRRSVHARAAGRTSENRAGRIGVMIDERVLGGVRFLDAVTRLPVDIPLKVSSDVEVKWIRTKRGVFAIRVIPGLDGADSDALDAEPGSIALDITVRDPSGQYLARRRTLHL